MNRGLQNLTINQQGKLLRGREDTFAPAASVLWGEWRAPRCPHGSDAYAG